MQAAQKYRGTLKAFFSEWISTPGTTQAGAILGVSRHEVQRLVRLGYLPAQRYGQVWLIQEQDARAYQRGRRGTTRQ